MRWACFLLLLSLLAGVQNDGLAQSHPQWGSLQAGPYEVGFRVVHTYDHSRGYWPKVDYQGRRDTLETARPMQISVWYPASLRADAQRMTFGEYITLKASALGLERSTPERRSEAVESLRGGPLSPFFPDGVSDEDLERVLGTPTAAVRDAEPESGPFPLVIHAGLGLMGQSVLLEYLASHGYVVATAPLLGTSPAWYHRGRGTAKAYQAGANDIGFVYGYGRQWPFADPAKAAVIGMFSADGLLFQMQHMQLDALAVLDGSYPDVLREVPGFDVGAIRIPILDVPRTDFRGDRSLLDSLRFADRYLIRFDSVTHGDFYQFQRIAHPERAAEHVSYRVIARYTRAFLDAVLKEDTQAQAFLKENPDEAGAPVGFMTLERRPAAPAIPTQEELLLLARQGAFAEARRAWEAAHTMDPRPHVVSEDALTTTLFFFRRDHGAQASIDGFRLLTDFFPESWRAQQHLGATYQQAGDAAQARTALQESLSLLQAADLPPEQRAQHEARLLGRLHNLDS